MINVLVTGGNGQLGQEFQYISKNTPGINFDIVTKNDLDISNEKELSDLFSTNKYHFLINCAAYTKVDLAETEKDLALKINGEALKTIGNITKKNNCKVIHISTDYVFDGNDSTPIKETKQTNPVNFYGETKLIGEKELLNSNANSIIIRTAWVYSNFGANFYNTMLRLGAEKKEISVVDDQYGTPTYAADLAYTIIHIINHIENSKGFSNFGVYHYSNEGEISWYDFTKEIFKLQGSYCKLNKINSEQYPTKAKRPTYSVLNKSKIIDTFKIKSRDWKEALEQCYRIRNEQL